MTTKSRVEYKPIAWVSEIQFCVRSISMTCPSLLLGGSPAGSNLPDQERQVLGAGLNCSESTGVERSPGGGRKPEVRHPASARAASPGSGAAIRAGARGGGRGGRRRAIRSVQARLVPNLRVGDTCPEKAFSSQRALPTPIGDTSQRKTLLRQRTARTVLKRGFLWSAKRLGRHHLPCVAAQGVASLRPPRCHGRRSWAALVVVAWVMTGKNRIMIYGPKADGTYIARYSRNPSRWRE
jgi:hypothetical protein